MRKKRIIFAVVAIPIVALLLILGNKYVIDVLSSILAILSLKELFNAVKTTYKPMKWFGYLLAASISLIHVIPNNFIQYIIMGALPITIIITMIQVVFTNMRYSFEDAAITVFSIGYVISLIIFIPIIYNLENGKILIWYVLLSAWGTDIFAYFVGCKFGKHKFTKISPNKSIEGCIAGICGSAITICLYTFIVERFADINYPYYYILIISIVLSFFGQIGDLVASSIKRKVGIKDYSNLIPGHGGILDRIDSIMFIAPITYFLLVIF